MDSSALQLQSLASMAHALAGSSPLLPRLEIAAEEALTTLRAASVSISRLEPEHGRVKTIINVGDLGPDEVRWPEDEVYVIDEASRLGQAIFGMQTWTESLEDPDCDPYERELLISLGKGSSLATSIVVDGAPWGEFYLTRHVGTKPFDAEAVSYAEILSAMLGAAVDRSLREAELEELARRDPLTGLSNRRGLDQQAERAFAAVAGTSRVVTVVSMDINGLKQVNDFFGHARGDVLIRSVGLALQDAFGDLADVCIARVGGDEFTVMVVDHSVDDVISRTNVVCRVAWSTNPHAGISAGIAVAELGEHTAITASALFAEADRTQYAAKRLRSTVALVSDEDWTRSSIFNNG